MSEEKGVIGALMVAVIMVASAGAVFAIGAGNERFIPGPEMPIYGELTYIGQGSGEGIDFNFTMNYTYEQRPGVTLSWSRLITGDAGPDRVDMPTSFMWTSGVYLDTLLLDSPWGQKVVHRYLEVFAWGNDTGLIVAYHGAETTLMYRADLVMPDFRATYALVNTNMTEIASMDLQEIEDTRHLTDGRTYESALYDPTINIGPCHFRKLIEPEKGKQYEIDFNSEGFTLFILDEGDIQGMIDGGYFRYDHDRSIVDGDNGTFVLPQGLYFMMGKPDGDPSSYWDRPNATWFSIAVTVMDE